ncbi:MAG: hypothetical protein ACYCSF_09055 [Acidimicrobiales bacterium]
MSDRSSGARPDPFAGLLSELSDGQQWKLIRADGWTDFIERLSQVIVELDIPRRQAIVMLLFAFAEGLLTPEQVGGYLGEHEVDSESGLAEFITWVRQFRPRDE